MPGPVTPSKRESGSVLPVDICPLRRFTCTTPGSDVRRSSQVPERSSAAARLGVGCAAGTEGSPARSAGAVPAAGTNAARSDAIGSRSTKEAATAAARLRPSSASRLRAPSIRARRRVSSCRARAMPSAAVGTWFARNACAISSRSAAYSRGAAPIESTRSSQASSRSMRSRRAAHQMPGCGQYSAHANVARRWAKQSARATCASSCRITARRRSAGHRLAAAGSTIAGRSVPKVNGITSSST